MSHLADLTKRPLDLVTAQVPSAILAGETLTVNDLVIDLRQGRAFMSPTQAAYNQADFNYYGHMEKGYSRLNMTDVFGSYDLRLLMSIPSSSYDIAQKLAAIFDVALKDEDVVYEEIPTIDGNGTTYLLKTSTDSPMWAGQRSITLFPVSVN